MIQVFPREVRMFYGTGGAGISDYYDLLDIANHGPIEHVPVSQSYIMSSATGEFATGERATGGLLGPDDRSHRTLFLSADDILDIREPDSPLYDPLLARLNVEIRDTEAFRRARNDGAGLEARYGSVLLQVNAARILADFDEIYAQVSSIEAGRESQRRLSQILGRPIEISPDVIIRIIGSASGGTCAGGLLALGYLLKKHYPSAKLHVELSLFDGGGSDIVSNRLKANATALLRTIEFLATTPDVTYRNVYGSNPSEYVLIQSTDWPFDSINLSSGKNETESLSEREGVERAIQEQIATNVYAKRCYVDLPSKKVDSRAYNTAISKAPFESFRVQLLEIPAYLTKLRALRHLLQNPEDDLEKRATSLLQKANEFHKQGTVDDNTPEERLKELVVSSAAAMPEPKAYLTALKSEVQSKVKQVPTEPQQQQAPETEAKRWSIISLLGIGKPDPADDTPDPADDTPAKVLATLNSVLAHRSWEQPQSLSGLVKHLDGYLQRNFTTPAMSLTDEIAASLSDKLRSDPAEITKIRDKIANGDSYETIVDLFVCDEHVTMLFNDLCKERLRGQRHLNPDMKPLLRLSPNRKNLGLDDLYSFISSNSEYAGRIHAKSVRCPADNAVFITKGVIGLRLSDLALSETGSTALRKLIASGSKVYALPELPKALGDKRWYHRWNRLQDLLIRIEDEIQHPIHKRVKLAKNETANLELVPRGTDQNGDALFPVIAFSPDSDGRKKYDLALTDDVHQLVASAVHAKKFFDLLDGTTEEKGDADDIEEVKAFFALHLPNDSTRAL